LVQAGVVLGEESNFSRAAQRLGTHQSALSRFIAELEGLLDVLFFERDHRKVELAAAGRKFVADARPAIELIERAMVSAQATSYGTGEVLNVGRSAYTDPWLAAVVGSVHLPLYPLYPGLQSNWSSRYSDELAHEVSIGTLDIAITTGDPEIPTLTFLRCLPHELRFNVNVSSHAFTVHPYYAITAFPKERIETSRRVHCLCNSTNDNPPIGTGAQSAHAGIKERTLTQIKTPTQLQTATRI
jgi:DNA-binding transcriptional LysR family regulator